MEAATSSNSKISFVSKARTAFHSAAAKAERVLTDFKSDFSDRSAEENREDPEKQPQVSSPSKEVNDESSHREGESKINQEGKNIKWRPANIVAKHDWHDRLRNIRIGRRGQESLSIEKPDDPTMSVPYYDENLYLLNMKNDAEAKGSQLSSIVERLSSVNPDAIPSSQVIRQLGVAVEAAKKCKSMKDLVASSANSSPVRERSTLSLAAVKSLVIRDKDEKLATELGDDERVLWLIKSLFEEEGNFLRRNTATGRDSSLMYRDIHGAPPDSLLVKLSEVVGSFRTLRKMGLFWCTAVEELRRLWNEEVYIPSIPLDQGPDLNSCLLYQQLQVINCCLSRKRRRIIAIESLEMIMRDANSESEEVASSIDSTHSVNILFAKVNTGELVLRLGADHPVDNLTMLETGEPVYSPVSQEGPLLTEDLIKENEEFVLRTGSVGAGCSQLLSDMQAFKAANPGCILEDFVRWHSPPDWSETEPSDDYREAVCVSDSSSTRGYLSSRMQKEGNLWRELWETSKPVPAIRQAPLYDEDLAVEGILNDLEDILPSDLFGQLFISMLGSGIIMAEAKLSDNEEFAKLYNECKDYVTVVCQGSLWIEKVDDLCQVYETVESMLINPEEVLKRLKLADGTNSNVGEQKRRFKMLGLNFGIKDWNLRKTPPSPLPSPSSQPEVKNSEEPARQPYPVLFENRSSLFSKRPPRSSGGTIPCTDENDWTIV